MNLVIIAVLFTSLFTLAIAAWDRSFHSMVSNPSTTDAILAVIIFMIALVPSLGVPVLISRIRISRTHTKEWLVPVSAASASVLFPLAINFDLIPFSAAYSYSDGIGVFLIHFTAMTINTHSFKRIAISRINKTEVNGILHIMLYIMSTLALILMLWAVIYFE